MFGSVSARLTAHVSSLFAGKHLGEDPLSHRAQPGRGHVRLQVLRRAPEVRHDAVRAGEAPPSPLDAVCVPRAVH